MATKQKSGKRIHLQLCSVRDQATENRLSLLHPTQVLQIVMVKSKEINNLTSLEVLVTVNLV